MEISVLLLYFCFSKKRAEQRKKKWLAIFYLSFIYKMILIKIHFGGSDLGEFICGEKNLKSSILLFDTIHATTIFFTEFSPIQFP